jgi:hypothetical protein
MAGPVNGDRRASSRVRFVAGVLPPAARLRPGREVIVVDLSRTGALVEGVWRVRPGGRVELQLMLSDGERTVRGIVERCYVASLSHRGSVRYRIALRFDTSLAFGPPVNLLDGYSVPT